MCNEQKPPRVSRRAFLAGTTLAAAGLAAQKASASAEEQPERQGKAADWAHIKGFNYQPSYGSSGLELWQNFNADIIKIELERGKKYFPHMNALRWWQSWESFKRDSNRYARDFETTLRIADSFGLVVMPVLFNRWHSSDLDYGGIYLDHFLPKMGWVQKPRMFDDFLQRIVRGHKDDPRVLSWDLCNEPYAYFRPRSEVPEIVKAESDWLKGLYDKCKEYGATAPVTVGSIWFGMPLEMVDSISDVLSIHPYWLHNRPDADKGAFEKKLDEDVAFANRVGKPLVATEACWGDLDDAVRVESLRYNLEQLKKRGIGWLVYLLHHSLTSCAHRPEFGPVGGPGNLAFIEADGSLRPGHEAFNEF